VTARAFVHAAVLALSIISGACAHHAPPGTPVSPKGEAKPSPAPSADAASHTPLGTELDAIFDAAVFDHAMWGVAVQSLDTGEVLYRRNAPKLMIPASNMKLLTMAVAAERLGWDYRFETKLVATAPVESGVLRGDVIAVGSGDPTISSRGKRSPTAVFEAWADALRDAGIKTIDGRIVGDDDAFDDEGLAPDWSWDDVGFAYAAPTGALQFEENVVDIAIRPGTTAGAPVSVDVRRPASGLTVVNRLITGAADSRRAVSLSRLAGQTIVTASGSVPAGGRESVSQASVDSPTLYFVRALRETLAARGIEVRGEALDIDDLPETDRAAIRSQTAARVLATHLSPPLTEVGTTFMKVSQNLFGETLLKAMGRARGVGTIESGRAAAQETLESWGIPPTGYRIGDGSGLSRRDYLSPETILALLRRVHRDSKHRDAFKATLPIAGKDGTLAQRMRGTRAEGLIGKTGTLANVRSLSGYITTADGETLAFSILANNFLVPTATIDAAAEHAAERLATFTRK
jgi:D-alanyl-D-alanine carboxypeptidase/D-alanyl-D-alanine-endopeptidase (penicillin-binding protein 4)